MGGGVGVFLGELLLSLFYKRLSTLSKSRCCALLFPESITDPECLSFTLVRDRIENLLYN